MLTMLVLTISSPAHVDRAALPMHMPFCRPAGVSPERSFSTSSCSSSPTLLTFSLSFSLPSSSAPLRVLLQALPFAVPHSGFTPRSCRDLHSSCTGLAYPFRAPPRHSTSPPDALISFASSSVFAHRSDRGGWCRSSATGLSRSTSMFITSYHCPLRTSPALLPPTSVVLHSHTCSAPFSSGVGVPPFTLTHLAPTFYRCLLGRSLRTDPTSSNLSTYAGVLPCSRTFSDVLAITTLAYPPELAVPHSYCQPYLCCSLFSLHALASLPDDVLSPLPYIGPSFCYFVLRHPPRSSEAAPPRGLAAFCPFLPPQVCAAAVLALLTFHAQFPTLRHLRSLVGSGAICCCSACVRGHLRYMVTVSGPRICGLAAALDWSSFSCSQAPSSSLPCGPVLGFYSPSLSYTCHVTRGSPTNHLLRGRPPLPPLPRLAFFTLRLVVLVVDIAWFPAGS